MFESKSKKILQKIWNYTHNCFELWNAYICIKRIYLQQCQRFVKNIF